MIIFMILNYISGLKYGRIYDLSGSKLREI